MGTKERSEPHRLSLSNTCHHPSRCDNALVRCCSARLTTAGDAHPLHVHERCVILLKPTSSPHIIIPSSIGGACQHATSAVVPGRLLGLQLGVQTTAAHAHASHAALFQHAPTRPVHTSLPLPCSASSSRSWQRGFHRAFRWYPQILACHTSRCRTLSSTIHKQPSSVFICIHLQLPTPLNGPSHQQQIEQQQQHLSFCHRRRSICKAFAAIHPPAPHSATTSLAIASDVAPSVQSTAASTG